MGICSQLIRSACFGLALSFIGHVATSEQNAPVVCEDARVLVKGGFGEVRFSVEIADTDAERGRGLMMVERMAPSAGMLFVFDAPGPRTFWMKNTLIPLDMIFVRQTGEIAKIHANAVPHDVTGIHGGDDIFAVLEINGGLAARFGMKAGDLLAHPAFSGGPAILPCIE